MPKFIIIFLDDLNNVLEEMIIDKPKTYDILLDIITKKSQISYKSLQIFYITKNNNEIIISNNEEYENINDMICQKTSKIK